MPDIAQKGEFGDHYVKVMVAVPTRLSDEQRRLLEEFARISGEEIKNGSFKEKLRKAFK
ncbi:MAG: molecular chaperone DnaJ, partial [Candidatus Omnitrophica bacterium CG12_big_fil_rev_8_21_14_0_65_50_5]